MEKEKLPKLEEMWITAPGVNARKFYEELAEVSDIVWELIKKDFK